MSNGVDPAVRTAPWLNVAWDRLPALLSRGAHAVLFHGPPGLGKKRLAVAVGSAALCESPQPDGRACGQCTGCTLLAAGHHPDLQVVVPDAWAALRPVPSDNAEEAPVAAESESDAAAEASEPGRVSREIRLPPIQALGERLALASLRGGRRVVVIAPAEALRGEAANALLKILEEPPPGVLFVLASDAPERMLPTILSRCLLVRVAAPTTDSARAWLAAQGVADADQRLAEAGGAPFVALDSGDEGLPAGFDAVLLRWLGAGGRLDLGDLAAGVPRNVPLRAALRHLQRWAVDLICAHGGAAVRYHPGSAAQLRALASAVPAGALFAWYDGLTRAMAAVDHPVNARHVIESALIAYREAMVGAGELVARPREQA